MQLINSKRPRSRFNKRCIRLLSNSKLQSSIPTTKRPHQRNNKTICIRRKSLLLKVIINNPPTTKEARISPISNKPISIKVLTVRAATTKRLLIIIIKAVLAITVVLARAATLPTKAKIKDIRKIRVLTALAVTTNPRVATTKAATKAVTTKATKATKVATISKEADGKVKIKIRLLRRTTRPSRPPRLTTINVVPLRVWSRRARPRGVRVAKIAKNIKNKRQLATIPLRLLLNLRRHLNTRLRRPTSAISWCRSKRRRNNLRPLLRPRLPTNRITHRLLILLPIVPRMLNNLPPRKSPQLRQALPRSRLPPTPPRLHPDKQHL